MSVKESKEEEVIKASENDVIFETQNEELESIRTLEESTMQDVIEQERKGCQRRRLLIM